MEQRHFNIPSSSNDGSISPMSSVPDVLPNGKHTVAFSKSNNSQQVARCLSNHKNNKTQAQVQNQTNKNQINKNQVHTNNMLELDLADYQSWTPKSPTIDLEVDDLKTMIRNNFYLKDKQREPVTPEVELLVGCEERREDLKINHRSSLIIKMRGVLKNCGVKFITLIIKISLFRKWQN